MTTPLRLADICVLAVADCFRGDGEILANPIGTIPMIGGRLARATFEHDLMMTDGEAMLVSDDRAFFGPEDRRTIEAYNPYRAMFDVVWSGRRHVMMGASQIDPYGNQNFAAIGRDYSKPKVQLLGFRGAPGNTINDVTSYWIPNHSTNVFVEQVDVVCGIGYDRAAAARTCGSALPRDQTGRHQPLCARLRRRRGSDAVAFGALGRLRGRCRRRHRIRARDP